MDDIPERNEYREEIRRQVISLLRSDESDMPQQLRRTATLLESMAKLLEEDSRTEKSQAGMPVYGLYAIHYIHEHFHEKLRITELADHIGVSRSYLSKLFREHVGMSPQEYLKTVRMAYAKRALASTDERIRDIAAACGYDDALAFSKMFKEYTGESPSMYRKACRNGATDSVIRADQDTD